MSASTAATANEQPVGLGLPGDRLDLHSLRSRDVSLDRLSARIQLAAARDAAQVALVEGWNQELPDRVLVTGSSGYLGHALVDALKQCGVETVGLDTLGGAHTDVVGSVCDAKAIQLAMRGCKGVFHTAALHAPNAPNFTEEEFEAVNVTGTDIVLREAAAEGVAAFIHTSTTSLMITPRVKEAERCGKCVWLRHEASERMQDPQDLPRNKYGRSKLAAELGCIGTVGQSWKGDLTKPALVILRAGRFFPEDVLESLHPNATPSCSNANNKVNELLGRRAALVDIVGAHLRAMVRAQSMRLVQMRTDKEICPPIFLLAAPWPIEPEVTPPLAADVTDLIARMFPDAEELFRSVGWTLPTAITRVYDVSTTWSEGGLGWEPVWTFQSALAALQRGPRHPLYSAVTAGQL